MVFSVQVPKRKGCPGLGMFLAAVLVLAVALLASAAFYGLLIMVGLSIAHEGDAAVPALGFHACFGLGFIASAVAWPGASKK